MEELCELGFPVPALPIKTNATAAELVCINGGLGQAAVAFKGLCESTILATTIATTGAVQPQDATISRARSVVQTTHGSFLHKSLLSLLLYAAMLMSIVPPAVSCVVPHSTSFFLGGYKGTHQRSVPVRHNACSGMAEKALTCQPYNSGTKEQCHEPAHGGPCTLSFQDWIMAPRHEPGHSTSADDAFSFHDTADRLRAGSGHSTLQPMPIVYGADQEFQNASIRKYGYDPHVTGHLPTLRSPFQKQQASAVNGAKVKRAGIARIAGSFNAYGSEGPSRRAFLRALLDPIEIERMMLQMLFPVSAYSPETISTVLAAITRLVDVYNRAINTQLRQAKEHFSDERRSF